jgi:integrase
MASLITYRGQDGKPVSYTVRWREGGTRYGPWQSKKFNARQRQEAKTYKALVEAHGNTTPPDDTQRDRGLPVPRATGLTVNDLLTAYIDHRATKVKSDRTIADYRRDQRLHLGPAFGDELADELDQDAVQEWVDSLDRAPKTISNLHSLLAGAYKWGASRRMITHNPTLATELPKVRKVTRGLRKGEWQILYQAACDVAPDVADLLLFLVGTGWRWSEATALQVHEVEGDRVTVTGVWRRNAAGQQVLVKDDAKSDAGLRTVRLSPRVAAMVDRRVTGKHPGDFVFTTSAGNPWRYSNFRYRFWAKAETGVLARAKAMGLHASPTIHWLRHTQVAMLIEGGASLPSIQRRIGHESITTTVGTYGRMVDDVSPEVLAGLDEQLFGAGNLRAVR